MDCALGVQAPSGVQRYSEEGWDSNLKPEETQETVQTRSTPCFWQWICPFCGLGGC